MIKEQYNNIVYIPNPSSDWRNQYTLQISNIIVEGFELDHDFTEDV